MVVMHLIRHELASRPGGDCTKNLRKDESGVINYLMIALLLLLVMAAIGFYFGVLAAMVGVVLVVVGFFAIIQLMPMAKGIFGVILGLILAAVGLWAIFGM
jgi:hypothetical protein